MTAPDLRGCPACRRSVLADQPECPHCGEPLSVRISVSQDGRAVRVERRDLRTEPDPSETS